MTWGCSDTPLGHRGTPLSSRVQQHEQIKGPPVRCDTGTQGPLSPGGSEGRRPARPAHAPGRDWDLGSRQKSTCPRTRRRGRMSFSGHKGSNRRPQTASGFPDRWPEHNGGDDSVNLHGPSFTVEVEVTPRLWIRQLHATAPLLGAPRQPRESTPELGGHSCLRGRPRGRTGQSRPAPCSTERPLRTANKATLT